MERPRLSSINHIKLAASDIRKTQAFYTSILGLEYIPQYDHKTSSGEVFAVMLNFKASATAQHSTLVEIRNNEDQAKKQEGWDPVTWGVPLREDLETWRKWFEDNGVKCSRVFTAIKGWVLCALDPDGKIVRVYCDEEHEWTTDFDRDEFWLA